MDAAMASNKIDPANPPFPWPRYLPFQALSGNQTSILISESAEGVRVALTRQKGGIPLMAADLPGGVNSPEVTGCAMVIFALGSASWARPSHVSGVAAASWPPISKTDRESKIGKIRSDSEANLGRSLTDTFVWPSLSE